MMTPVPEEDEQEQEQESGHEHKQEHSKHGKPGCGWGQIQRGVFRCRTAMPKSPPASPQSNGAKPEVVVKGSKLRRRGRHQKKKHQKQQQQQQQHPSGFLETSAVVLKAIEEVEEDFAGAGETEELSGLAEENGRRSSCARSPTDRIPPGMPPLEASSSDVMISWTGSQGKERQAGSETTADQSSAATTLACSKSSPSLTAWVLDDLSDPCVAAADDKPSSSHASSLRDVLTSGKLVPQVGSGATSPMNVATAPKSFLSLTPAAPVFDDFPDPRDAGEKPSPMNVPMSRVVVPGNIANGRQSASGTTTPTNISPTSVSSPSTTAFTFDDFPDPRAAGNKPAPMNAIATRTMRTVRGRVSFVTGSSQNPSPVASSSSSPVRARAADPETLREAGNKEYRKGRFAEAVSLYDRSLALDPDNAACRADKAAVLTGLGKLLDAVEQCKEAVRIDRLYFGAHHRLADLYLRLGDTVKAMNHYQLSGGESGQHDFSKTRSLRSHMTRFTEARTQKDWTTVLAETQSAVSIGADSCPQVFASQAEALLRLQRHQEAEKVISDSPAFDSDASARFFGPPSAAYALSIRAQVELSAGRFDAAAPVIERAAQLDSGNKEVSAVARRIRAVSQARNRGDELFKANRFREACAAYQEGLDHESCNAVLLCDRATCLVRMGQWEEALTDCDVALRVRPGCSNARKIRADCNSKLERWEAAIRDYEVLVKEEPDDEEASRALWEARFQLMKLKRT